MSRARAHQNRGGGRRGGGGARRCAAPTEKAFACEHTGPQAGCTCAARLGGETQGHGPLSQLNTQASWVVVVVGRKVVGRWVGGL